MAAFEGLFDTTSNASLALAGWVDDAAGRSSVIGIPGLLSYLLHGDAEKPVRGLNEFERKNWPPVNASFQFYHLMIVAGIGLVAIGALGFLVFWHGSIFERRWLLWLLVLSVLGPQIGNEAGWFAAETGRQPWIVYGLLRTSESLSKVVSAEAVLGSIILFSAVYALLFAAFIYLLNDKIQHGPDEADLRPAGKWALPTRK
jgi:cytochrome d ubiquinol oxidase subunit I